MRHDLVASVRDGVLTVDGVERARTRNVDVMLDGARLAGVTCIRSRADGSGELTIRHSGEHPIPFGDHTLDLVVSDDSGRVAIEFFPIGNVHILDVENQASLNALAVESTYRWGARLEEPEPG
jgi:hypothetical protein